jgi:hypothetical protein
VNTLPFDAAKSGRDVFKTDRFPERVCGYVVGNPSVDP